MGGRELRREEMTVYNSEVGEMSSAAHYSLPKKVDEWSISSNNLMEDNQGKCGNS